MKVSPRVLLRSLMACTLLVSACQNTTAPGTPDGSGTTEAAGNHVPKGLAAPSNVAPALALQTAELMVEGTSCASCAVTIRRHLHQLQGIGEIREGSTKQHLLVEFDPSLVTAEQLIKAVSDAGYEAEVWVHASGAGSMRQQGG